MQRRSGSSETEGGCGKLIRNRMGQLVCVLPTTCIEVYAGKAVLFGFICTRRRHGVSKRGK